MCKLFEDYSKTIQRLFDDLSKLYEKPMNRFQITNE